jgi:FdhE protein
MNIGEVAKPPFAVLPDPASLFLNRSKRLAGLAPGHRLEPYLRFLAVVTRAQHDMQEDLPAASLPAADRIAQALQHGMPPLLRGQLELHEAAADAVDKLLARLAESDLPAQTSAAVYALRGASSEERRIALSGALEDALPEEQIAQGALLLAGAQVHFARLAAKLVAADLKPVADGACPVCGSAPMVSSVVGWPGAHNTRFCTCSLCAAMWNVVRVKCLLCGSTERVAFRAIDGAPDTVKAETCDKCKGYVKILYQVKDPALEPLADDVATLGLDMLLAQEGWKRGGQNPFLLGY